MTLQLTGEWCIRGHVSSTGGCVVAAVSLITTASTSWRIALTICPWGSFTQFLVGVCKQFRKFLWYLFSCFKYSLACMAPGELLLVNWKCQQVFHQFFDCKGCSVTDEHTWNTKVNINLRPTGNILNECEQCSNRVSTGPQFQDIILGSDFQKWRFQRLLPVSTSTG